MIRVELPQHLRTLAHVSGEVKLEVEGPVTQRSVLDALEAAYPMLCGTIPRSCHAATAAVCAILCVRGRLVARSPPDAPPLPDAVASGDEPLLIIGAIAGG